MRKIGIVGFLVLSLSTFSQINQEIEDTQHKQIILIDQVDKAGFLMDNYKTWFTMEYESYKPNLLVMDSLKSGLAQVGKIKILVFMATWCHDSREQMPRFLKIIEPLTDFVEVEIFALDEFKTCPSKDISAFEIERVPTFLFYKDDTIIGKIIESPNESIEADFLKMLD